MTIQSIKIKPEAFTQMKHERLERTIASTVNGALDSSKKAAASDMAKLGDLSGLGDLLGGG